MAALPAPDGGGDTWGLVEARATLSQQGASQTSPLPAAAAAAAAANAAAARTLCMSRQPLQQPYLKQISFP